MRPLYEIEILRNDFEKAKKIFDKKNNLSKDDITEYERLKNKYEKYSEKDYLAFDVKKTDKQFLIKDIINLFNRILNKEIFIDGTIENYESVINDLLKEYERKMEKENEKDAFVKKKDKFIQAIKDKISKINISSIKEFS